jgi:hypothetical protein
LAIPRRDGIVTAVLGELTIKISEQCRLMIVIEAAHCRVLDARWQYGSGAYRR